MRAADFPEPDARRIARDRRRPRPRSPPLPSLARLADAARSLVLHNAVAGEDIVTEGDDADDWIILLDSGASASLQLGMPPLARSSSNVFDPGEALGLGAVLAMPPSGLPVSRSTCGAGLALVCTGGGGRFAVGCTFCWGANTVRAACCGWAWATGTAPPPAGRGSTCTAPRGRGAPPRSRAR